MFESLDHTTDQAIEKSENLLRKTEDYYELKFFQYISTSLSLIVNLSIIGSLALIAMVLLSIALSTIIGSALGSWVHGLLITAAIFIVLVVLSYLFRKQVEHTIIRKLSQTFFS